MSYRDLLLEAEQTIQELEAKIKRLSLIDWKGLFETRVILLQKTEIKLNDAASRLAKAQDAFNHFPDSDADFNEPHEGMSSVTRLYYGWAKVEKWKDKMEKALGGDE